MVECGDGDRRAVAAGRWRDATRDSRASSAASSHDWPLGEMVAELETMAMKVEAAMAVGRRARRKKAMAWRRSPRRGAKNSAMSLELGGGGAALPGRAAGPTRCQRPRRPAGRRGWCWGVETTAGAQWPAAAALRWGGGSARVDLTRRGGRCRTGPGRGGRFFKHSAMRLTTRSPPGTANQRRGWPLLQLTGRPHGYFIF
jgi:hypothetical protein